MDLLADVHTLMVREMLRTGRCPDGAGLARLLDVSREEVTRRLRGLEAMHAVVLHPDRPEPWVLHPFSVTPTLHYVDAGDVGWWAPCVWCGLGVAALRGGMVTLHTRVGAEREAVCVALQDGEPVDAEELVVHFAVPPRHAWNNVHEHCAMVLAFRSAGEAVRWCERHALPLGECVPLKQVARFAAAWYGTHASETWHKWSIAEAGALFTEAGLVSDFWTLPGAGTY